jgi:hypothetical protein
MNLYQIKKWVLLSLAVACSLQARASMTNKAEALHALMTNYSAPGKLDRWFRW